MIKSVKLDYHYRESFFLPEMKLGLISLRSTGQGMKMGQDLNSVVRLNVMHSVTEHIQECV